MKNFLQLYYGLDETNSTNRKLNLLVEYFQTVTPSDSAWVVYFLAGNRFKRIISYKKLWSVVGEILDYPKWLLSEIWASVGDTAETIALSVDTGLDRDIDISYKEISLTEWVNRISSFRNLSENEKRRQLLDWWKSLDKDGIFLITKLLTGGFRVGVSKGNTAKALAKCYDLPKTTIIHRLSGDWDPTPEFFQSLTSKDMIETDHSKPYPFFLASPLEGEVEKLGNLSEYYIEWKWDGIRAQLIRRNAKSYLWSRGDELINKSFPEIINATETLPDGIVLDGEIIAYFDGQPLAFSVLQRRIGRENISSKILEEAPVVIMVYDIMEYEGKDIRQTPMIERRKIIEDLFTSDQIENAVFKLSPLVNGTNWDEIKKIRENARERQAEGFILKRGLSSYQTGRKRGDWWKWKINPFTIDAILIYAQAGSGRRASLFTDYTFGLWDGKEIIPIGKTYKGLTDEEMKELDRWIRKNTVEKSGAFRAVDPSQVFELAFDGIMTNKRTRSGISLRFTRIFRWRKDKPAAEADKIETLREFLQYEGITEVKRYQSLDDFFN
ncbi:MAG: ATP-dependent DNA ligase [Candidatus Kariarchaeaceae archaeon]